MARKEGRTSLRTTASKIHNLLVKQRVFLRGNLYEYIGIGILFFIITLFLTNFTILHGDHELFIDGPGDGTAGFLWFNTVENDASPVLGHTDMANYPDGEDLYNPTQVTYTLVWTPLWIVSKLFGPIMGLNIITYLALFFCACSMYWLVKKLTDNPAVAFFAGYAAAYTPYHLVKSSSHLTYIFSIVFILMLAAFIGYWKRPTTKRALLFVLTLAIAFYTDGYYLLIGSILAALLVVAGLVFDVATGKFKDVAKIRLKHAVVALCALVLLLIPIGATQLLQGSNVNKFLSGARGSIAFDIEYYSTHPIDFLIPSSINPFLKDNKTYQSIVAYQNTRSNTSENNTYIGYTVLILIVIGVVLLCTYGFIKKKSHLSRYRYHENYKLIFTIGLIAVPVLVWCMLSPSLTIHGKHIVTLAHLLLDFHVSLWRVMARFYLPLHVILVVMAAMSLAMLTDGILRSEKLKKWKYRGVLMYGIVAFVLLFTAVEYATALSSNSYDFRNLPKVYMTIKKDKDIKVIAELPLLDRPLTENYNFATAQLIHGKKTIDTPLTNNIPGLRTALGSTSEAVDYAIARGADTIITHTIACKDQPWGQIKYVDENKNQTKESSYYGSPICVYTVDKDYRPDTLFAKLQYGTFSDAAYIDKKQEAFQQIYMNDGWLNIADQEGHVVQAGKQAHFTAAIQFSPGTPIVPGAGWEMYQGDELKASGAIPGTISVNLSDASKSIHVRVTNLKNPTMQPFMISLRDIVVTAQ